MRKFLFSMILIAGLTTLPFLLGNASADTLIWTLYDDFESDEINTDKWEIDCDSGNVTIVDGRVRFEHIEGFPNTACLLRVKEEPENIIGLRATMEVESCTGTVRGRLGALLGILDDEDVYQDFSVRPYEETIAGDVFMLQSWHNKFSMNLEKPIETINEIFTMTITFKNTEVCTFEVDSEVDRLGRVTYELPAAMLPPDDYTWRAYIGTRSESGGEDGPCVVYFDDVYVSYADRGDELAVDFGANGLWHYDGTGWTSLAGWNADSMVEWEGGLAADFGTYGLWNYDGSSWTNLAGWNPDVIEEYGSGLTVDFDTYGVWHYDGSSWTNLAGWNAEGMEAWGSGLAADFGAYGLWNYDGASWSNLAGWDPEDMIDVDLY